MDFNQKPSMSKCGSSQQYTAHRLIGVSWKLTGDDKKTTTQFMCQHCAAMFTYLELMDLHQKRHSGTCAVESSSDLPASP